MGSASSSKADLRQPPQKVLFHGAGLDCEPREGGNVLDDLYRCCPWIQGVIPCDMVFEARPEPETGAVPFALGRVWVGRG